jgi:hypothetical protein
MLRSESNLQIASPYARGGRITSPSVPRGVVTHDHASQEPSLCHQLLSLCNWYRSLFTNCFRALGDNYLQYAVVEVSLNLVLINRIREAK